jgi:hypothetical protein
MIRPDRLPIRPADAGRPAAFEALEPRLLLDGHVYISEFMADNESILFVPADPTSNWDWIELHNPTADPVSLAGWHLTDDDDRPDRWTFPNVTMQPGEYLLVYATSTSAPPVAGQPLHANFSLSKGGEYLGLFMPGQDEAISEFYPEFPDQDKDISYGLYESRTITPILSGGQAAYALVPANSGLGLTWTQEGFTPTGWLSGPGAVGYESLVPGLAVRNVKTTSVVSLADAENVLATPSRQTAVYTETAAVINYLNTGGTGHFQNNVTFPGFAINVDANDFVIEATGYVTIPAAGLYTFGVNSDDGFGLTITGATTIAVVNATNSAGTSTVAYDGLRGASDTFGVYTFAAAGQYELRLVMFEHGGGSSVELFAATGDVRSWDAAKFRLVGDTAAGGLAIVSVPVAGGAGGSVYTDLIGLDVKSAMLGTSASAYVRIPFVVTDPAAFDQLTLRMMYDDGFVAYLNGVEVARRNAPATLNYNSAATAEHANALAAEYEDIDITPHLGLLHAGTNVLAVHGLNVGASDGDFLIGASLADIFSEGLTPHYFSTPSPGSANLGAFVAYVADTNFSVDRGFYDMPFSVAISTKTPDAAIYYTTDGSAPSASHGTPYAGPVLIGGTTTLRAVAVREGWEPSNVDTQTYIFISDVLTQNGAGLPAVWGPVAADYEMDPNVVTSPLYSGTIRSDLLDIPTMSIVMDVADIFGPNGIYSNTLAEGLAWERAGSIEYILPDGSKGFQENCGVRMYGGVGRNANVMKHSFRLLFKGDYGDTKLRYSLFEDSPVDEFDTIILRANFNDAWGPSSYGARSQFIRDEWTRKTMLDIGQPASHGTFVHLYVNGQYWGLYNVVERPDAAFAASYGGGEKEEYDAINAGEVIEGDRTAWNTMIRIANTGHAETGWAFDANALASAQAYALIKQYCDVENLIDYMLMNFHAGNTDWDGHNWYAARRRVEGGQYRFFAWDTEWAVNNVNANVTNINNDDRPSRVFQQLCANAEFRLLVADHIQRLYFNGGALTAEACRARYLALAEEVDRAVVPESARWGDLTREPPYTRDTNWVTERDWLLNTYFPQRSAIALQQLVNKGLFPSVTAPAFNQHGGTIPSGFVLTMTAQPGAVIYYTTDGSDPRLSGGAVSATAQVYSGAITLTDSRMFAARALSGANWSPVNEATFLLNVAPSLRITELMYHPSGLTAAEITAGFTSAEDFEYVEFRNIGSETLNVEGIRFANGLDFTFPAMTLAPGQYALAVKNAAAMTFRYGSGLPVVGEFQNGTGLSNGGERLVLEGPVGGVIHDFSFKDGWYNVTDGEGFSLVVRDQQQDLALWGKSAGWQASDSPGGSPAGADTGVAPGSVIITELLTHTDAAGGDWIELHNTTGAPLAIGGWFLSDDPLDLEKYEIPAGTVIPVGGYVVFSQAADFGNPANPLARTPFGLSELGEAVYLSSAAPGGGVGGYRERQSFGAAEREVTFGLYTKSTGATDFVAMAAASPGEANGAPLVGPVVFSEVMYNPLTGDEFIELYNRTGLVVPLYDPAHPENTWRFTEGVGFTFPAGASLAANGYGLVVGIDPAAFRAAYNVPAQIPIWGPYTGLLDDGGESLELARPGDPEVGTGFVPYIRAERLTWDDVVPWPTRPDGLGSALQRTIMSAYGNDPAAWEASTTGGTPGAVNMGMDLTPPTAPLGVSAAALTTTSIRISWAAASDPDTGISYYRIWRDGLVAGVVDGATPQFIDNGVDPARTYQYQVSALNGDDVEGPRSVPPLSVRIVGLQSVSTPTSTEVVVRFTEVVTAATAEVPSHYTLTYNGGASSIAVLSAVLQPDGTTVRLTVAQAMVAGVQYTLAVQDIQGQSGIWIVPNCQATFGFFISGSGTITREYWLNIAGGAVANLTSSPNYPNNPTGSDEMPTFEAPINTADNYGTRMRGYIHPPETGEYVFWIASDDNSELWLSTDENPANKVRIAYVPGWTNSREWGKFAEQRSVAIYLESGRKYYIEALQKEGGGGDNLAVGWRKPSEAKDPAGMLPITGLHLSPYVPLSPTTVGIWATDATASEEGQNPGTFTVSRTGSTDAPLTVFYTVGGTAVSGDYTPALSGTVTMGVGATQAYITITPVDDLAEEPTETLVLTLSANAAYGITTASATISILDNDTPTPPTVSLAATDAQASETGPDAGRFTVTRTGPTTAALTVYYTVSGTATQADYVETLSGTIVIPAGSATAAIDLTPVDDATYEGTERVTLTLSANAAYVVGTAAATVDIADNDANPAAEIHVYVDAFGPASESGPVTGMFFIGRSGNTLSPVTIYYTLSGTAGAGDYQQVLSGSVSLASRETYKALAVTPVDDGEWEGDESLILTVTVDPAYIIDTGVCEIVILDNETPPSSSAPAVTGVVYNALAYPGEDTWRAGLPVGGIEPGGVGVHVIDITFSEVVNFSAADVTVQSLSFDGNAEINHVALTPTVGGSGTTLMRLTLPAGSVTNTWVKVTLSDDILSAAGVPLDGEACADGAGRGYIYAAADMPTGNGTPGGDAVFYVGSLLGDFWGPNSRTPDRDGQITRWDITAFTQAYQSGALDADLWGANSRSPVPEGAISRWDITAFTAAYQNAMAAGTHLEPLPTYSGPLAGSAPQPLADVGGPELIEAGAEVLAAVGLREGAVTGENLPQRTHPELSTPDIVPLKSPKTAITAGRNGRTKDFRVAPSRLRGVSGGLAEDALVDALAGAPLNVRLDA